MYLDSRYRVHLEWMFENQPTLVLELMRKNKLKDLLDRKEQQALKLVMQLKEKQGLTEHEAFEVAVEKILAPADGPAIMSEEPPKALDSNQQAAVYKYLDRIGDEEEALEAQKATKH
jgi:hypothetical protein